MTYFVQAVSLFNANRHEEAMRRVQDLATAYQRPHKFPCSVINVGCLMLALNFLTLRISSVISTCATCDNLFREWAV
jgi:hypothetical protein